jgi:hypothetical protein
MRKRRIFYVPDMISLLGLPILLLVLSPKIPPKQRVLTMVFPYDGPDPDLFRFSKSSFLQDIKRKKLVYINLNYPDPANDSNLFLKKLDYISQEIARLQFLSDTFSVLKIGLGANNTYGNFIWLVNQAKIYGVKRYVLVDDNFYLLANRIEPVDTSSKMAPSLTL